MFRVSKIINGFIKNKKPLAIKINNKHFLNEMDLENDYNKYKEYNNYRNPLMLNTFTKYKDFVNVSKAFGKISSNKLDSFQKNIMINLCSNDENNDVLMALIRTKNLINTDIPREIINKAVLLKQYDIVSTLIKIYHCYYDFEPAVEQLIKDNNVLFIKIFDKFILTPFGSENITHNYERYINIAIGSGARKSLSALIEYKYKYHALIRCDILGV